MIDLAIPGNDDGIRSIEVIVRQLADAIAAGNVAAAAQERGRAAGRNTPVRDEPKDKNAE